MSLTITNGYRPRAKRAIILIFSCLLLGIAAASARAPQSREDEIKVVTSGAFTAAYLELVPEYERASLAKITTEFGPSMGTTHNAIPVRLERGEAIDVVIMAAPGLDDITKEGRIRPGSRVDLVQSKIGMAVKAGAPKPDISTLDALKRTLLAAKSIGYSDSASGVYLSTELFPKLGIADQIKSKCQKISRSGWWSRCLGRGRNRIPTNQRTAARQGHRYRRRIAAGSAARHHIRRRHPDSIETSRSSQGAHSVARLARRLRNHKKEQPGTGEIQGSQAPFLAGLARSSF